MWPASVVVELFRSCVQTRFILFKDFGFDYLMDFVVHTIGLDVIKS